MCPVAEPSVLPGRFDADQQGRGVDCDVREGAQIFVIALIVPAIVKSVRVYTFLDNVLRSSPGGRVYTSKRECHCTR